VLGGGGGVERALDFSEIGVQDHDRFASLRFLFGADLHTQQLNPTTRRVAVLVGLLALEVIKTHIRHSVPCAPKQNKTHKQAFQVLE
jgi:hypothetical protein